MAGITKNAILDDIGKHVNGEYKEKHLCKIISEESPMNSLAATKRLFAREHAFDR